MRAYILLHTSPHQPARKERARTRRFPTTFFQKGDVGAHNKDEFTRMKVIWSRSYLYSYSEATATERAARRGQVARERN